MVVILVVGVLETDSGKTVMASSIVRALRREGFNVAPSKPVGAVDLWRSPWVLREVEERGIVVSGDAVVLHNASGGRFSLEAVNPLAMLLLPVDPSRFNWSLQSFSAIASDPIRRAALARLTACSDNGVLGSIHLVNDQALERAPGHLASQLREVLHTLNPKARKASDSAIQSLLGAVNAIDACVKYVKSNSEALVIESHGDIAVPVPLALQADLVVVVSPGRAGLVSGSRYRKAVEVLASLETYTTLTVRDIIKLTGIMKDIDLPVIEYPLQAGYSEETLRPIIEHAKESSRR